MSEFEFVLPEIMKGLKSTFGDEFFDQITLQLNKIISADYTFIASVDMIQQTAKTISVVVKGEPADNFEYGLDNSPCAVLLDDSVCIYPQNIRNLFPKDKLLIDMNIEGYVGVSLHNSHNETIGIIVALHKTKIKNPQFAKTLFELFSGRISAEMERTEQNNNLENLNDELESKVKALVASESKLTEQTEELSQVNEQLRNDIVLREQSEKEALEQSNLLRAVRESNRDLQFILDIDGVITDYYAYDYNDLYLAPENFIGKKMLEVLPANVAKQFQDAVDAAISTAAMVSFDYVLPMPKGDCTYDARIVSILDKRLVVTVRDITERMQLEGEVLKARKLESIGILAGGIAHDFNNILGGLFGNIELAKMKLPEDHAAYCYIETSIQAFERATQLTQQLLTFAKGGDPLLEAVNIKQIIRESLEFNLSGSNVKGVLNLPDNLWQGKVDKGQISQVVSNLTINAKQAMPNGGILTIDAENVKYIKDKARSNLTGDYVKIRMRDEGIGISNKYLEKIFDPYFTTKQTGSGLGLATVHSIVTKHNGHISVESKAGTGTTFTLYLPADKELLASSDTAPARVSEKSNSIVGRILVMDDDVSVRELFSNMLESLGYSVDSAIDGDEALDKYTSASKRGKPFDIIIMDLTIPGGMGGKEAITELLEIDHQVKVIVSSGYSTDPIMASYGDYGFSGRLAKPFKLADMVKEISRVMELR